MTLNEATLLDETILEGGQQSGSISSSGRCHLFFISERGLRMGHSFHLSAIDF